MAITVTDPRGGTLSGIRVEMMGPADRSGETNSSGNVNFPGLQGGTYRLRFSGDEVITYEREVTIRPGQIADLDVTLNPAPPPRVVEAPAPPPAPIAEAPPPAPLVGPPGTPQTLSVPDLLEENFVGSQPRRETVLACSGNTRSTMIQLNAALPERLYENADASYYVIGGEGVVRIAGRETKLATNGFVSVPRGTAHAFVRNGRRPLILLGVLSGEPCEEAK
ncbi:MAG TPA: carboxypeptidase regulatory-like domain-containing protein [Vicinamibacterales bacterium]